jgi:hypothetical protein
MLLWVRLGSQHHVIPMLRRWHHTGTMLEAIEDSLREANTAIIDAAARVKVRSLLLRPRAITAPAGFALCPALQ